MCLSLEVACWLLPAVSVENPKIRGLAAQSILTMNQELEGHKGIVTFQLLL